MNKRIILSLLLFLSAELAAQETSDTLTVKRRVFTSTAYRQGVRQNNSMLYDLYAKSKAYDAERQMKHARVLTPAGAAVSVAGLALSINALIGVKKTTVIDNVEYTYFKRPVANALGGVALLAAGVCLMEFGSDKKEQSVDLYNKKKKHDALTTSVGLNKEGRLGLKLSF